MFILKIENYILVLLFVNEYVFACASKYLNNYNIPL